MFTIPIWVFTTPIQVFTTPIQLFTMADLTVHDGPRLVFTMVRSRCSRWTDVRSFYYTNALMRIAAAAECLEVHHASGTETEATKKVRRTVNVLKHELSTTSGVRMPPMALTIQALEDVLEACKTRGVVS